MKLNEQITLNKFICKCNIYGTKDGRLVNELGQTIKEPLKVVYRQFKAVFGRLPEPSEIVYISSMLFLPYDFDNVTYKSYLKQFVNEQNKRKVKDLKENYNNYLESIADTCKSKQCIYISGASGSGKTTYAKILASRIYNEEDIYITSGGQNPFDEYYGEKCIIIDDFRDSILSYNDLLRLLDNHTSSNVGARYHNKSLARCELIILTSVKTPQELYRNIDEERYQLYRRITYFNIIDDILQYRTIDRRGVDNIVNRKFIDKEINDYLNSQSDNRVIDILNVVNFDEEAEELPF